MRTVINYLGGGGWRRPVAHNNNTRRGISRLLPVTDIITLTGLAVWEPDRNHCETVSCYYRIKYVIIKRVDGTLRIRGIEKNNYLLIKKNAFIKIIDIEEIVPTGRLAKQRCENPLGYSPSQSRVHNRRESARRMNPFLIFDIPRRNAWQISLLLLFFFPPVKSEILKKKRLFKIS